MGKKLILAMLACLLVLVCAACGGSSDAPSGTEATDAPETEVTEQAEPEEETEDSEVTPEFKAAMDSYEEFFDEYGNTFSFRIERYSCQYGYGKVDR